MTVEEAKKIIDICIDTVKKSDGEVYVNKEYVLQILSMVEMPSFVPNYPSNVGDDNWPVFPPGWPKIVYDTKGSGPGFEKVPWWVWYKNPLGDFTCDSNSTGSKPQDPNIVVTSAKRTDYIDDWDGGSTTHASGHLV